MINKKGLWFVTLFSLIVVVSVYYITMPNELLLTNNNDYTEVTINESDYLQALRVNSDNEVLEEMEELQSILTDTTKSIEIKNEALEKLKNLNIVRGEEEQLEHMIKETYNLSSFIKVKGNDIKAFVKSNDESTTLANNIMRTIQSNYSNKVSITIKFQK